MLRSDRGGRLPQAEHHEILRVGQSQLFQDGLVGAYYAPGRDSEREAELLLQQKIIILQPDGVGYGRHHKPPIVSALIITRTLNE